MFENPAPHAKVTLNQQLKSRNMSQMTRAQFVHTVENAKNILILTAPNAGAAELDTAKALHALLTQKGISAAHNDLARLQTLVIDVDLSKTSLHALTTRTQGDTLRISLTPSAGLFTPDQIQTKTSDFRFDLILTINVDTPESQLPAYSEFPEFFQTTTLINLPADFAALQTLLN